MEFSHVPVLYDAVIENLDICEDGIYVDGTLGGGGHSSGICSKLSSKGTLIGIDRDDDAIEAASKRLEEYSCKKIYVHSNYSEIKTVLKDLKIEKINGALLDLGVSSFQLDESSRGFSYQFDAPLDMRMDRSETFTAKDVVNGYSREELTRIIKEYGEEKWATRIAEFICKARSDREIESTYELVDVIKAAIPASARREGPHPAKRTFQAIRIEVNHELDHLKDCLDDFIDALLPGGRFAVISFHSLEDRIVKECFQKHLNPCTCPPGLPCVCGKTPDVKKVTRKPVQADTEELLVNPRARSAKLRVIEKI